MKDIPLFPKKRVLELSDKPLLDALFKKYPPVVSEMTFSNLFAWRQAYGFCLSKTGEAVLVVSEENGVLKVFDPLTAPANKKEALVQAARARKDVQFIRLPQETADMLKTDSLFSVKEDRDQFDYVYRSRDLAELAGKPYDAKRNFVRRFKEQNSFEFLTLTQEHLQECLFFEDEWCQARDCQGTEGLKKERQAVHEMLTHFEQLDVTGAMIRIQGKIEAVTLGEAMNHQTFVVHIEKANGALTGIYQAINQMFSRRAESLGFVFINREQDLGVPGLRKAKESYHPAFLVKKFCATLKR